MLDVSLVNGAERFHYANRGNQKESASTLEVRGSGPTISDIQIDPTSPMRKDQRIYVPFASPSWQRPASQRNAFNASVGASLTKLHCQ